MKDKTIKIIFISFITMAILCVIGLSYAYFSLEVEGEGKDIVMSTGDLRLEYKDETPLNLTDAMPGDSVTKVITVTNLGTKSATYSLYWGDLINTIENYELHVTLDCKSYINYSGSSKTENGTCNNIYRAVPISNTKTSGYIKKGISIDPGVTQEYTVTILFDNKNYPQNDNLNKKFTGKIGIEEYQAPKPVYCTFDGDMVQGAEYTNGQYTYRYKQEGKYILSGIDWSNIGSDGWGVQLTNKESTDAVNSKLCTYINDKPVVSMTYMFSNSQATLLDVSRFDTSNVIDMNAMFHSTHASILDTSNFDTSKVTNMSYMFYNSQATMLDVSNFDTSNVTDMGSMFSNSKTTILDVSGFNTSNVTDMSGVFYNSQAKTLNIDNFDTSNVTNMSSMFYKSQTLTLNVSGFDTSKVTDMSSMFYKSLSASLDVSNFNTSNVTNMNSMFSYSQAKALDVSGFNTSKITDMGYMFSNSQVIALDLSNFDTSKVKSMDGMFYKCSNLETIYASDKFVTNNVTSGDEMFKLSSKLVGGAGTVYNANNIDKTYARIDGGSSNPGYFTNK